MTSEEVREELKRMAYCSRGFDEVVTFVWALPDCFWSRVCKRLIATIIVGVQPSYPTGYKPQASMTMDGEVGGE